MYLGAPAGAGPWVHILALGCSLWADRTLKALVGGREALGWGSFVEMSPARPKLLLVLLTVSGAGVGSGTAALPEGLISHFGRQSLPSEGWRTPLRILANSIKSPSAFR